LLAALPGVSDQAAAQHSALLFEQYVLGLIPAGGWCVARQFLPEGQPNFAG